MELKFLKITLKSGEHLFLDLNKNSYLEAIKKIRSGFLSGIIELRGDTKTKNIGTKIRVIEKDSLCHYDLIKEGFIGDRDVIWRIHE